jgi:hypothetical protein
MRPSGAEVSERQVVLFWQEQVQKRRFWSDSEGNPVEVLYPGRLNDGRGGDFRDALIGSDQGDKQGCIEVHTRAGGWFSHGHHLDPTYNRVILHVVWEPDINKHTLLQNGQMVPTIALKELDIRKRTVRRSKPSLPCHGIGRIWSPLSIEQVLIRAGDIRFEAAASKFAAGDPPVEPGQALFQGISEALGYSKNKLPFRTLAGCSPLSKLEEIVRAWRTKEDILLQLQAALLGQAGLMPSQRFLVFTPDDYSKQIEAAWSSCLQSASLAIRDWELFKVRPGNHPVLRIAALSHLLYSWRWKGCLETLLDMVRGAPLQRANFYLESAFQVSAGGYWEDHFDFGSLRSKKYSCLLGRPRAAEIVINVLLPFCSFQDELKSEPALGAKAREIYASYPRLESNAVERHMLAQLGLKPSQVRSARCQQGLIHIYKNLCIRGKCGDCGFSK